MLSTPSRHLASFHRMVTRGKAMVTNIPHHSRLRFGRLNYVQTDAFNRQNRTIGISEITPNRT
jgi:hypothetical protein